MAEGFSIQACAWCGVWVRGSEARAHYLKEHGADYAELKRGLTVLLEPKSPEGTPGG